jgi:hypothetical protein
VDQINIIVVLEGFPEDAESTAKILKWNQ